MRVLMLCHYFPPHIGGIETVALSETRELVRRGHDVTVVSSDVPRHSRFVMEAGVRIVRRVAYNGLEQRTGIPYPLFGPGLLRATWREAAGADVVHVHDSFYMSSLIGALCALGRHRPLVVTQHVDLVEHPKAVVVLVQRLAYATIGRVVLRRAEHVAAINPGVAAFVRGNGVASERISILPNGVDTTIFFPSDDRERQRLRTKLNLPSDQPLALFVGRFVPKKGYARLVRAGDSRYTIVFVGDIAPTGLENDQRFVFLGALPHDELAEVYRACDVFVAPSSGEGLTLTMIEAMASGLPLVTNRNTDYQPHDLDPEGILLMPEQGDLRTTLIELFDDQARLQRMRAYSLSLVAERYSWIAHVDALLQIYGAVE